MALSDNEQRADKKSGNNRSLYNADGKWWSDRQKLECVQLYLVNGNAAMTGRMLKIPEDTVRRWRQTEWWKNLVEDLRVQDNLMTSARMQKIIEKTFETVEDRLENGDWVYDQKTGALRRKGVSMKDAHKVAVDLLSHRQKLLSRQDNGPETSEGVDDKLAKLADKFASMVNSKITPPNDVVDIELKVPSENSMQGQENLHSPEETRGSAQGEQPPFQGDESEFDSPDPLQE